MDQIQNVGQVSFQANTMPAKEAEQMQTPAMTNPIENGDEKSMDALKWAGIIGAGVLTVGAVSYAVLRNRAIDFSKIEFKDGKCFLKSGDDGIGKLERLAKGIKDDGLVNGRVTKKADGIDMSAKFKKGEFTEITDIVKRGDDSSKTIQQFYENGKVSKTLVDSKEDKEFAEVLAEKFKNIANQQSQDS